MSFLTNNLLTILIFLPAVGTIFVMAARTARAGRLAALAVTATTFGLSLLLLVGFDWKMAGSYATGPGGVVQMVQRTAWIPAFNIEYFVGVDGLSFPLVVLSTFICLLACVASLNVVRMTRGYMALLLLLETGVLGTFLSLDFFLFYVFFEITLVPMYFLIGIWGGPRKEYAAIKFFLFTLVGSVALLIVLIGTFLYSRDVFPATAANPVAGTFDLIKLASPEFQAGVGKVAAWAKAAPVFFVLAMVAFLVKLPSVPLHTWLPDAHVEAPTPMSMILAAVLLKMGGYGLFRVAYPLFPEAGRQMWMVFAIVGVVSILYGALVAMAQTDFKRLVAYSSVSHMGFVVLGAAVMTKTAAHGAVFMMVAHGVTSAMMFFVVGVVYDRAHHREMSRLGGIAGRMPVYAGLSAVAIFATLGLPGLCGFVGEVMVLLGSFEAARPDSILARAGVASAGQVYPLAVAACVGLVLTAGYMLWALQRVFFGAEKPEYAEFAEIDGREQAVLWPLAAMAILLGVLPSVFVFTFTGTTVDSLFKLFGKS
ncbi:MAG: NuoM family protein [Phycisphaerae bacterium]|nr:NADH-quinone oxidoreductase subunit M [Tepidisphaeraceae bacterium]